MSAAFDFNFSPLHFAPDPARKRDLFKASVSNVEIEVSAFCNRACWFCPNAVVDRRGAKNIMSDETYSQIMSDLESIDYDGTVAFHRYNEPLADRPYILRRIAECARRLPRANPKIFTNGDYLNAEYLENLRRAGLRELIATVYLGDDQRYDPALMRERFLARLAALGLPYRLMTDTPEYFRAVVQQPSGLRVLYRAIDFETTVDSNGVRHTVNRAGAVPAVPSPPRRSPCIVVFNELQVEVDGTVVPCCNIRTDVAAHKDYRIGRIGADGDTFDVWNNAVMAQWRRSLFTFGAKAAPCDTCSYKLMGETPAKAAQFDAAARALGLSA